MCKISGAGVIVDLLPNKKPSNFTRQCAPVLTLNVDAVNRATMVMRIHAHEVAVRSGLNHWASFDAIILCAQRENQLIEKGKVFWCNGFVVAGETALDPIPGSKG